MKKIELLAPAGNMKCLQAAIEAGCDAVYLGGKLFGARGFAGNFSKEELKEAICYAHLYGVKVYLTVNTIIYEKEVNNFIDFVRYAHKNNVDAVIIQDLGMLDLLRSKFPNLEIHASTQMHIHNYEGVLFAKKYGIKRVVMARETPLEIIQKIKKEIDIEVETFVHGALCISYSGQCLASTLIGPRSGNRGTCTQICRKKYDLYSDNKKVNINEYLLSTKDLCMLKYVDKLIESGIDSLKIEGRMKRPEYVYLVTSIYKKAIDNYYKNGMLNITDDDLLELKKMFNREFTKGFMLREKNDNFVNQQRPNHQGVFIGTVISKVKDNLKIKLTSSVNVNDGLRILDDKEDKGILINKMYVNNKLVKTANKGDIISLKYEKYVTKGASVYLTTSSMQIKAIDDKLKNKTRKVMVDVALVAKKGKSLTIKVSDGTNIVTLNSNDVIDGAINNPTSKEIITRQINKMGNTIYKLNNINIDMDDNIFINIKDINELRRKALDKISKKRLYNIPFIEKEYNFEPIDFKKERKKCILTSNKVNDKYDVIYTTNKDMLKEGYVLKLPRVINHYKSYDDNVLISEVGSIMKYNVFETDFSFNVTNSYALYFLHKIGAKKVTLSLELSLTQIKDIVDNYRKRYNSNPNVEVIVNSYPEAMITKFDLNKMYNVKNAILKDEFGNDYKLESHDDYMVIKHYKKINVLPDDEYYEAGVNSLRQNVD